MPAISKKETAKVAPAPPSSKPGLPQATVQMQKTPPPSAGSQSTSLSAINVVPQANVPAQGSGDVSPVVGAVALVVSLAALAMQVWMLM